MLGHLKRKVLRVQLKFVDLTDEIVEEFFGHDRLAGKEVHAIVGPCEEGGPAIVFNGVFLSIKVSHESDSVVNTGGKREELLLEVASGSLIEQISNCADKTSSWRLVTAQVVCKILP